MKNKILSDQFSLPRERINTLGVKECSPLIGDIGAEDSLRIPGDKSLSHRAALFAALADGESRIYNFQVSGVTKAMLDALRTLTIKWALDGNNLFVDGIGLYGMNIDNPSENIILNCGNSATTMRLLAGALAVTHKKVVLDGSEGLCKRPMDRIVEPLKTMNVQIEAVDGHAPLTIEPSIEKILSITYELKVASAQVKSSILLASLRAEGKTILYEPGPSRDHSERMLRGMGVKVSSEKITNNDGKIIYRTELFPPETKSLLPLNTTLPSDISAAAFIIVATLITPNSEVKIRRVGLNPTRTGLLDVLLDMGADIIISNRGEINDEPYGDISVHSSQIHGIEVNGSVVVRMIDEFPIFAIAAAYADGDTLVSGAKELRHKETDRIEAISRELTNIGGNIEETPDGFIIHGGKKLSGGVVESHHDHRLAMSLSIAGLISDEGVIVKDAGILTESFPDFPLILKELGACVEIT